MKSQHSSLRESQTHPKQKIIKQNDQPANGRNKQGQPIPNTERDIGLDRLVFFSDAVIAIAITFLAIDLRSPNIQNGTAAQLFQLLARLEPQLLAFIISFFVIGMFWTAHHRIFLHIKRYDRGLLWINLIFLFLVVSMPFPTSILANFSGTVQGVILYASVVAAIGLVQTWLWRYATHQRHLVEENLPPSLIRDVMTIGLGVSGIFFISILIALINPHLAEISWSIISIFWFAMRTKLRLDST